jgi:hypothetical protein
LPRIGHICGTVRKDIFGNIIEKDKDDKKRVYKRNIHGDLVVEDEGGRLLADLRKIFSVTKFLNRIDSNKNFQNSGQALS